MPASLSVICNINLKSVKLIILLLLSPLFFFAQTLTGLWVGTISNDSNTVRKDQSFEIALTEYRGKVYGYSRSEFIVDDVLYYVMKRVKGTIEGDVCEVKDDEIISFNFPKKIDKGVKVTSTFYRNKNDGVWYLAGTWKTSQTKNYYSVTGKVDLQEEKDLTTSKIFPHLEELKLADDVAFYKDRKEGQPIVKIAKPEKINNEFTTKKPELSNNAEKAHFVTSSTNPDTKNVAIATAPVITTTAPQTSQEEKKLAMIPSSTKSNTLVVTDPPIEKKEIKTEPFAKAIVKQEPPVAKTQQPTITKQPDAFQKKPETNSIAVTNPETKINAVPKKTETVPTAKTDAIVITNSVVKKEEPKTGTGTTALTPEIKKPEVDVTLKAALIAGRKSEFSQIVNFKSDSLELSLYDNGEVDGDTVTIFMNGEVILAKQGLKASAIKKTIYITPGNEDFTLVMFAENLGKYPPNTGLLVVHDGDDVYNLRFSSDFQKNAGIVFRRKKN